MEDHNKQHVHGQDNHDTGTWVLITVFNARMLGRIHQLNLGDLWRMPTLTDEGQEVGIEKVIRADIITLMPVYDFFAPLRPVTMKGEDGQQRMMMARDPLVVCRDFTVKSYPVHVRNGTGVTFDFLSQMHSDDQKVYRDFIKQARQSGLQASAQRAGLELPRG